MEIPCKWEGEVPKRCKYHAKWKANMAECRKYHAACKVTMSKWKKYHAKWQILVPNCCKYKADGTRKESQQKFQNLSQKQIPKLFCTHNFLPKFPNNNSNSSNYFTPPFSVSFQAPLELCPAGPRGDGDLFVAGLHQPVPKLGADQAWRFHPANAGFSDQIPIGEPKKKCWNTIFVYPLVN